MMWAIVWINLLSAGILLAAGVVLLGGAGRRLPYQFLFLIILIILVEVLFRFANIMEWVWGLATVDEYADASMVIAPLLWFSLFYSVRESVRQKELKDALVFRDAIFKELNHRVKNNLSVLYSLITLERAYVHDAESAHRVLESLRQRIRGMVKVHTMLYQSKNLAVVDFAEYIRSAVSELLPALKNDTTDIRLDVRLSSVLLTVDDAVPCGLLINELLTNALKHAFPAHRSGTITVALEEKNGIVFLSVADDGVGMPVAGPAGHTMGMELVKMLSDQLHGTIQLTGRPGTRWEIRFPVRRSGEVR